MGSTGAGAEAAAPADGAEEKGGGSTMVTRETSVSRVAVTEAAAALMRTLYEANGPLMFLQSGGCCDGSSPMCYLEGEFRTGASDVLLERLAVDGVAEPVSFWMGVAQFERWRHTHLTVDVVRGRGSGFSLEAPEGVRFMIRSRLLTDAEEEVLERRALT